MDIFLDPDWLDRCGARHPAVIGCAFFRTGEHVGFAFDNFPVTVTGFVCGIVGLVVCRQSKVKFLLSR
jgi:hypothetical protein